MKILRIAYTIFALLFGFSSFSQNTNFQWAKQFGGSGNDQGLSVSIDLAGNVYTTGCFSDTVDFDPGVGIYKLISSGYEDVFISKLDAKGNFLWAKQIGAGGGNGDIGRSIITDALGNVYTTGYFEWTVDFNPGSGVFNLTSDGGRDVFVTKLDANGNFVWAKRFGGAGNDDCFAITVDSSNNIYTTGYFYNKVDFDPGNDTFNLTSIGEWDVFISKLDQQGEFVWAKQFGGIGRYGMGNSIKSDALGNVYIIGEFDGTLDFNPGIDTFKLSSGGTHNAFVVKLNSDGNFLWAKLIGGSGNVSVGSIAVDAAGNVITTGAFSGFVDFNPDSGTHLLSSVDNSDIFICKLNSNGNYVWVNQIGSIENDAGNSVCVDAAGTIFTTGHFGGTTDFDSKSGFFMLDSHGGQDAFISIIDSNGDFVSAKNMGGADWDFGNGIAIDFLGNIYTTGYFNLTADFNPDNWVYNLTSHGGGDIFVHRLGCRTMGTDSIVACNYYTWINEITYFESNNTATSTLTNAQGCDSVVKLNLTIKTIDKTVSQHWSTLTANQAGATYQWLDCNNDHMPIANSTFRSFTPTLNGNYAVEVKVNGCAAISSCYNISNTGISNEYAMKDNFKVYPNPAQNNVTVSDYLDGSVLNITDFTGRIIYKSLLSHNKTSISTEYFPKGIYLLYIENSGDIGNRKLLVIQ
jgi:hypothetical protein